MRARGLSLLVVASLLPGCQKDVQKEPRPAGGSAVKTPATPEAGPVTVRMAYGSEKKTWLEEQVRAFEATSPRTKSGRAIHIKATAMGSGEATQGILSGKLRPHVFSPASGVYITLLNQEWLSRAGHTKALCPPGEPLVISPIVIAMWKPMAEALGWPAKQLGWADLLRVAANPKGWGALGHPEWGRFKLGHTHPEYSNSGVLSVLAEAYAGAHKVRGLTVADLDDPKTQKTIEAVEQTIVHYGESTGFFAKKMVERGPTYLSAAVMYENLVIESYARSASPPLVAVYPAEGTFWSDHPYAILDADWVGPDERDAAQRFLAFLRSKPAQERALVHGFRPADPAIPMAAPIDAAHGVDPKQPQTLLEVPDGPTLAKLLEVWKEHKKTTDVILVFDKSGSMRGLPLAQAKEGAHAFLATLHPSDEVTLLFFDDNVYDPVGPVKLGKGKADLDGRIDGVSAGGGTALYEAIARAVAEAHTRAAREPGRIHAVVVMTDGHDESSKMSLATLQRKLAREGESEEQGVRVFTIAYGDDADKDVLGGIAEAAKGASAAGSVENIAKVFKEMGAFL